MQHQNLADGRWQKMKLVEQLANIGSEVLRALKWQSKNYPSYAQAANMRALELFDLTLQSRKRLPELTEIARARELWLDFFMGNNRYHQTAVQWENYFLAFNRAAQIDK